MPSLRTSECSDEDKRILSHVRAARESLFDAVRLADKLQALWLDSIIDQLNMVESELMYKCEPNETSQWQAGEYAGTSG